MRISRILVSACCLIGMFASGFVLRGYVSPAPSGLVPTVQAQGGPGSRKCSNRTLKGAYGIRFQGQKIGEGPVDTVSRITFDGEGSFTTNEIGRFNGNPIQRTFTGPYTVNDDCTGILDFSSNLTDPPHEAHGNFVIVDEGREFYIVDDEQFWSASGVGKRL